MSDTIIPKQADYIRFTSPEHGEDTLGLVLTESPSGDGRWAVMLPDAEPSDSRSRVVYVSPEQITWCSDWLSDERVDALLERWKPVGIVPVSGRDLIALLDEVRFRRARS